MHRKRIKAMTNKAKTKAASANENAAEVLETIANVGNETVETVLAMGGDAAAKGYKNASAYGKESLDDAKAGYDKFIASGKDNLDAYSKATSAVLAGFDAYYGQILAYTKKATAENADIVEKFYAAKTPQHLLDVQFEAVNNSVNQAISQSTELNKIATDTANKAIAPIKDQIENSVEIFAKPFAA